MLKEVVLFKGVLLVPFWEVPTASSQLAEVPMTYKRVSWKQ